MEYTALTSAQFLQLRDFICSKLGLFFEDSRTSFLQKRIEKRMRILNVDSPGDYLLLLRFQDVDGREMQALANLITTNETYMFREFSQLRAFSDFALPEVLMAKQTRGDRNLRIWSAGCSSGEEPYTLAIILRELLSNVNDWNIEITATDIDQNVLSRVNEAVYDQRSVREVPDEYFDRHFTREGSFSRVRPETAALVKTRHLNLHDRMALRTMRNLDFIFCRNVLIYFSAETRKTVVDYFYTALNPGGFIFLGHSESVGRISTAFKLVRLGDHLSYKR
ncbi:MAG: methyltransferase, CheR-type [Chthoniobacteraceae bacterium]|nr:methyltransferase, CheR-type [Chthoniobacteraceae bacterium]